MARHSDRWATVVQQATGVITPEAVRLEFADAGIGSRGVALLIDAVVLFTALLVVTVGAAAALEAAAVPDWFAVSALLILNLVLFFGYPIVAEVGFGGRTLGKAALGLRVVTREGAPVGFRHAAIRSAFMLVDFVVTAGAGAVLSAALTRRSQRLGDLVAGTVVLRQRQATGSVRAAVFAVPAGAERYAALVSPNAIDAATYERIRAYLLRAPELDDAARHRVAVALAAPLLPTTPAPPAGMPPAAYLQVLAAVYQRGGDHPAPAGSPAPEPAGDRRHGPAGDAPVAAPPPASADAHGEGAGGFAAPD